MLQFKDSDCAKNAFFYHSLNITLFLFGQIAVNEKLPTVRVPPSGTKVLLNLTVVSLKHQFLPFLLWKQSGPPPHQL